MRIKPPSLGCLYVAAVMAALVWLTQFLWQAPWFERGGREEDLGWIAYLERTAPGMERVRRRDALGLGLGLSIKHEQWDAAARLLRMHRKFGLDPSGHGIKPLSQGEIWSFGLAEDKWTKGQRYARFLVFNPHPEPRRYAFHWRTKGSGKGHYDSGDGEARPFELVGEDWKEARVLVDTIPAQGTAIFRFRADQGFSFPGEGRSLGLLLEKVDFDADG